MAKVNIRLEYNKFGFWYEIWDGDNLIEQDSVIVDDCENEGEVKDVGEKYLKQRIATLNA